MNRMRLRGKIVFVGEAKYRRSSDVKELKKIEAGGDIRKDSIRQPRWEREEGLTHLASSSEVARKDKKIEDPNEKRWTKKLEVVVAKENLDWLQRSLIGGTTKAIDFSSLQDMVAKNFPQVIQICKMGAYKALLTFDSLLNAEETYTFKMNSLLQIFHSVWRCDESKRSESQRVWLKCFGIPLHVWNMDTFKKIGGQWGEVVGCDQGTKSCTSLSVGRVLIDTCAMDVINEWVHITVGTSGFDVSVKEVGQETYSVQCTLEKGADTIVGCIHRKDKTKISEDAAIMPSSQSKLIAYEDNAEVVVMEGLRRKVEDEDRLVNSELILNEWNNDHLKLNRKDPVMNQQVNGDIQGLAEFVGLEESAEVDSELTIPWSYEYNHNGLSRENFNMCKGSYVRASRVTNFKKSVLGQGGPSSLMHGQLGAFVGHPGLDRERAGRVVQVQRTDPGMDSQPAPRGRPVVLEVEDNTVAEGEEGGWRVACDVGEESRCPLPRLEAVVLEPCAGARSDDEGCNNELDEGGNSRKITTQGEVVPVLAGSAPRMTAAVGDRKAGGGAKAVEAWAAKLDKQAGRVDGDVTLLEKVPGDKNANVNIVVDDEHSDDVVLQILGGANTVSANTGLECKSNSNKNVLPQNTDGEYSDSNKYKGEQGHANDDKDSSNERVSLKE
ncbi:hypothetical protein AAHE18_12G155000 [Arachis hypogaea]